jgi:vancomycin resistance protein YoaR
MKKGILIASALVFTPIIIYILSELWYFGRVYPNTYIGNLNVSGKTKGDLEKELSSIFSLRENQTVSYSVEQTEIIAIKLDPNLLKYDKEKTIQKLIDNRRNGPFLDQLKQKISFMAKKQIVAPEYNFDDLTYDTLLADKVRKFEKEVVETNLLYLNNQFLLTPSKPGILADRTTALRNVRDFIELKSDTSLFTIKLNPTEPKTTRENSQEALAQAQTAISRPFTLKSASIPDKSWSLDAPQIADFIEFKYDDEKKKSIIQIADYKVASYSAEFAPLIEKTPIEAKYEVAGNKVVVIEPSQDGQTLDTQELTKQITARTLSLAPSAVIEIPIKTVKAALTMNNVNQFGIKDQISSGKSAFKGSGQARIHNIKVATEKLNGVIIKPNETFSMYKTIGNIEKATGFEDSYIIKNGRTVVGVGGGVCQVATTLFRAALNAGLQINERHPHSYRVFYYEIDSPPGLDASIYFPGSDLRFTNNTGNNILIQTKFNQDTSELQYNFFGVKDNRTVTIDTPTISNQVTPPQELRLFDATIPQGTIRQTEYAAQGATIKVNRKVTKDGKDLLNDNFTSYYRPWQAVYRIGTKTN